MRLTLANGSYICCLAAEGCTIHCFPIYFTYKVNSLLTSGSPEAFHMGGASWRQVGLRRQDADQGLYCVVGQRHTLAYRHAKSSSACRWEPRFERRLLSPHITGQAVRWLRSRASVYTIMPVYMFGGYDASSRLYDSSCGAGDQPRRLSSRFSKAYNHQEADI